MVVGDAYKIGERYLPRCTKVLDTMSKDIGLERFRAQQLIKAFIRRGYKIDYDDVDFDFIKSLMYESEEYLRGRGEFGTEVHKMLEDYVSGNGALDDSLEAQGFLLWVSEYSPNFLELEKVVYSLKYEYAGTIDVVCNIDGKLCLVDYKTSNNISKSYDLQLAAYAIAYEEMTGKKVDKVFVLQLGKNKKGRYFKEVKQLKSAKKAFLSLLEVFHWSNPNFEKNIIKKLVK